MTVIGGIERVGLGRCRNQDSNCKFERGSGLSHAEKSIKKSGIAHGRGDNSLTRTNSKLYLLPWLVSSLTILSRRMV